MRKLLQHTLLELLYHSPFTALGTLIGVGLAVALTASVEAGSVRVFAERFFHVTHPLHMFLSAIVTTAVFYRHKKQVGVALLIGVVGAVGLCTLSDILIPYAGGRLLGVGELKLHVCILEHPSMVLTPAIIGALIGVFLVRVTAHPSLIPHGGHVLLSVSASILYFMAFGALPITEYLLGLSLVVFAAVLLPCCASDILLPMLLLPSEIHVREAKELAIHWVLRLRRAKDNGKG